MKRFKTNYPGVFYREAERIGGTGTEKVYYIVFKKDGKVLEEKAGRQFADAMTPARANAIRSERIEGKRLSRKDIRLRQEAEKQVSANRWTIDRLWEEYKRQNSIKGIIQDENRYKKHIKPFLADKEPKDLVPLDVDRVRLAVSKTHKPQTTRNILALLRRIINFGEDKRLSAPLNFTIKLPTADNEKTEDLTPNELSRLLEAIHNDTHTQAGNLMLMALFTGMRRGELFRLEWSDLDFERSFIRLRDPKSGKEQTIPMNAEARKLLEGHERTGSPFVFPGRSGQKRVDIHKTVNRIKDAAGLPRNFRALHGLRHVYASMLASSGKVDMYTLQKLLTHKSPQMTQRYAHLRDEALRSASELAGTIIGQAMNGGRRGSDAD